MGVSDASTSGNTMYFIYVIDEVFEMINRIC